MMRKIIISGCNGHMGRVVAELCEVDPNLEIAAGFDVLGTLEDFTSLYPAERVKRYGSTLTVEKGMEPQVAVLDIRK